MSTVATSSLDTAYPLDDASIRRFREDGFIRLPGVLSPEILGEYGPDITGVVDENNRLKDIPFETLALRPGLCASHEHLDAQSARPRTCVQQAISPHRGRLMGTRGVRMWHDQALYKEPSGGFTPWHVDQHYWPMSGPNSITAWIPLQPVPMEMGPLCFGRGSHRKRVGRDLEISAESEQQIRDAVRKEKIDEVQEPYALGDVSYHLGWTLHPAGPNQTASPRRVFTIIYMDIDMRLAAPANKNQQLDWETWTPGTKVGDVMNDPLNPVLYE